MANNNQNKFDFSAFLKERQAEKVVAAEVESKNERRYFLIVTEGVKTEPIYFEYWASKLPKNLLMTITVHGAGDNTLNVVKQAIQLRNKRKENKQLPDFDEVWAVYDKDDFPVKDYHAAIELARLESIESAHSNQSFELWYVLHYQNLQSNLHRSQYIEILSKQMGFKYMKNTKDAITHLSVKGNLEQAIRWAKALEELHADALPADACPSTRVYELISRLRDYIE